jgi:hypothetical protein
MYLVSFHNGSCSGTDAVVCAPAAGRTNPSQTLTHVISVVLSSRRNGTAALRCSSMAVVPETPEWAAMDAGAQKRFCPRSPGAVKRP